MFRRNETASILRVGDQAKKARSKQEAELGRSLFLPGFLITFFTLRMEAVPLKLL
jgi:hypothetical protein